MFGKRRSAYILELATRQSETQRDDGIGDKDPETDPTEPVPNLPEDVSDFSSGSDELYEPPISEPGQHSEDDIMEDDIMEDDMRMILGNETEGAPIERKRKRKGQINKKEWKRQKNSLLRLKGESYIGFKKDVDGKYKQASRRESRKLKGRCNGHPTKLLKGGPRQNFLCSTITDEERQLIFSNFWALPSWEAKRVLVKENVIPSYPKHRKKTNDESSRKQISLHYSLTITEGANRKVKKQVCKTMFLNTLSLGEKSLRTWILEIKAPEENTPVGTEKRVNSRSLITTDLENFLNSLPTVESHYCRASTGKLYLEPSWFSLREMHRYYVQLCKNENKCPPSWTIFFKTLKKMNLDLYTPKKDQCDKCTSHKYGNIDEQAYQQHTKRKDAARTQKENDKKSAIESQEIQCYTIDVQAVLLSPRLNVSATYYKTKLKVHNLTFFDMSTKDATCYLWHEGTGGLDSDNFASLWTKFLTNEIEKKNPKKIILWSDGCGYQNRNAQLSSALLELSIKHNTIIEQKYLEVGHTQMEVDSIHATIEKKLGKRRQIFVPGDYVPIIESARLNPRPYLPVYCDYSDFKKFDAVYYKSVRPGNKVGDPCVNDVVAFQYHPDCLINFKLDFKDIWAPLPRRPSHPVEIKHPNLYQGPCAIDATKLKHLQDLKQFIPRDYHFFYDSLISK